MGHGHRVAAVLGLVTAIGLGAAHPALADDPTADAAKSFRAGSDAYKRGDMRAAARAFDEAFRIAPRGAAAYNAGISWEGAGEALRAADDYTSALETSDLGTAERADATGRLRGLERSLARVTLSVPGGTRVTLDDVEQPAGRTTLHVKPGAHVVQVQLPNGPQETRPLTLRAGASEALSFAGGKETTKESDAPSDSRDTSSDGEALPRSRDDAATASTPVRWPAWVAFGAAVVASGVAIGTFEDGLSARNQFNKANGTSPDVQTTTDLRNKALSLRTATWVAWSLAGAAAVTGVVLYLYPPTSSGASGPQSASARPFLAASLHEVSIGAAF